jgi:hypothetical protein
MQQNTTKYDGIWYDFGGIGVVESLTDLLTSDYHQASHGLRPNSTFGISEQLCYLNAAEIIPDIIAFCCILSKFDEMF